MVRAHDVRSRSRRAGIPAGALFAAHGSHDFTYSLAPSAPSAPTTAKTEAALGEAEAKAEPAPPSQPDYLTLLTTPPEPPKVVGRWPFSPAYARDAYRLVVTVPEPYFEERRGVAGSVWLAVETGMEGDGEHVPVYVEVVLASPTGGFGVEAAPPVNEEDASHLGGLVIQRTCERIEDLALEYLAGSIEECER